MQPFQTEDIFEHVTLTGLQGSPSHDQLLFKRGRAQCDTDGYERTLWRLQGGRPPEQLTEPETSGGSPRWNSDATQLAFLGSRGKGGRQVHLLRMSGGEALRLTHTDHSISMIEGWSPDDTRLLVLATVEWQEDGEVPSTPKNRRPPRVARFLPYKSDGSGITAGTRTHLYAVDARSGELSPLTQGDYDVTMGRWSPDGKRLAYLRDRTERMRHRTDVWVADADGSRARRLIDCLPKPASLAWSPDGRWLALSSAEEDGDSRHGLWIADAGDGTVRRLGGEDFEIEPASLLWHPDGDRVLALASHRGLIELAVVDAASGEVRRFELGLRQVTSVAAWGERIAFVATSMRRFEEVYSIGWQGDGLRCHTHFNRSWLRERERPRAGRRRFAVPDGNGGEEQIDAWILRPAKGDGPFPLFVDMHGGPHSTVLMDFAAHTYWYTLCARGWAVVAPNAVGSGSYGKTFAERLRGHWGERDLPQFEAVVRRLQADGFADDRVVCGGKSYGGFLSAWAAGHSDLFKAAVVAAPVANIESHYGTSDSGFYVTPFAIGGDYQESRERYHRLSPIAYCHQVEAAVLILQGGDDGRCPRGQSEELFTNLVRCTESPVELVIYPGSTHSEAENGRPSNRVDYHARIVGWAERWTMREDRARHAARDKEKRTPRTQEHAREHEHAEPAEAGGSRDRTS